MRGAKRRSAAHCILTAALVPWACGAATAENIDPGGDGSQYAWGENIGWLNAEPSGNGGPGLQVTDSALTGWIWGENIGWVSLSCQNTSSCSANSYGVTNDGKGNLSGFAWAENIGWISFQSARSDCCSTDETPGCTNSPCEAAICALDPHCCYSAWDVQCAAEAARNAACSTGCAANPFGVEIDRFSGRFSGEAWAENAGWINFGGTPAESWQIETDWRCPDGDEDSVCSASDNCPNWANPGLGAVQFGQTVFASSNKADFVWSTPVEFELAEGTFTTAASIGAFIVDVRDTGSGTVYTELGTPGPGFGHWYIFRPDCVAGSYSTGLPSEVPGRDTALIP